MSRIRTFTGKLVDPLNLKPADVDPHDIAHSLALKCRFNAHTRVFYSVAEHCLHVATMLPEDVTAEGRLAGLLHDASECYLPDLPAPTKHDPSMFEFRTAELRIMNTVSARFNLHQAFCDYEDMIHVADKRLVHTEARDLMNGGAVGYPPEYPPYDALDLRSPLAPIVAERLFLERFFAWSGGER